MLSPDQVQTLQAVVDPTAVSVLITTGPGYEARLEAGLAEVADRLGREVGPQAVAERLEALRGLAAEVAEPRGQQAVALFAGAEHRAASRLPEPVRDRVVIDDTFATRDLVRAQLRSPATLVLLLGERPRLFAGRGRVVREVTDGHFPVDEAAAGGAERGRRRDPGQEREHRRRRQARAVDLALDGPLADGDQPLFAVGATETVAAFTAATRHRRRVAGEVTHGLAAGASAQAVAEVVWPTIEDWLADQQVAALHELDAATGARRLAAGIHEVWALADEGRGDLLVVEDGYEVPARLDPVGRLVAVADATASGVVDDVVDEAIEAVLLKGGRVAFVADGVLADRERIALKLRY